MEGTLRWRSWLGASVTHVLRRLRQRSANLGFDLVNRATGELVEGTVS